MKHLILPLFLFCFLISCKREKGEIQDDYTLEATENIKSFPLDSDVKYNAFHLCTFEENGKRYLSFHNNRTTQLLFYDFDREEFLSKVTLEQEGPNGVGMLSGYYIKDFNHIYVSSFVYQGIIRVDTTGAIVQKIPYGKTDTGYKVIPSYMISSHPYILPIFIGDKMYITQQNNERFCPAEKTPISVAIDTVQKKYSSLPLTFSILTEKQKKSNDTGFSRDYDGKNFIYSFYVDEDILVTSIDHAEVKRIRAKSRYIDSPDEEQPLNAQKGPQLNLELARYGDLMYDPYREVYYRFAYPKTELDDKINWMGKSVYGRKKFSVIILDKDFQIIGETLFPEAIYNPYASFVSKEGLYISRDYQMNYDQSEDFMTFELFKLVENK